MCPLLQDQKARLSAGDLVALEKCYHSACVVGLHKRAHSVEAAKEKPEDDIVNTDGIALAELIFIEQARTSSSESIPVFKLPDLANMYDERMKQLGIDTHVQTTRLKERILCHVIGLEAFKTRPRYFVGL